MPPVSSGTVSTYNFTNRKIIDHACRRAGIVPQRLSAEDLEVCLDLLFTLTSEWANAGFPLWTRQFGLLGCQIGSPNVQTPPGTVEVLHSYWRIFNPYRGPATLSTGAGDILLFGGQPNADVNIPGPNPAVSVNFTSITETDTIGVLSGVAVPFTAALQINVSVDGVTWVPFQTLPSATYTLGQWTYFDLNPTVQTQYLQIVNPGPGAWVVNQLNFALANGQDIENGPLNIDDYYNLPNKMFRSDRPNSTYQDRQVAGPVLFIWPTLNTEGFYNGTVSCLSRRYIQDPGTLTNIMELPQRWFEAIVWRLASRVIDEIPQPSDPNSANNPYGAMVPLQTMQARTTRCETMAARSEALVWSEERVRAPIRLMPSITPYTR